MWKWFLVILVCISLISILTGQICWFHWFLFYCFVLLLILTLKYPSVLSASPYLPHCHSRKVPVLSHVDHCSSLPAISVFTDQHHTLVSLPHIVRRNFSKMHIWPQLKPFLWFHMAFKIKTTVMNISRDPIWTCP